MLDNITESDEEILGMAGLRPVRLLRKYRRILREGSWAAIGQAATALGLLLGTRALTELTPPSVFGTFTLLLGLYFLGRSVFCVSVLQAALRFYPDLAARGEIQTLRRIVSRLLTRTMAIPIGACVIGGIVYSALSARPFLPFVILAALLGSDAARSYETNYFVAARRQKIASLLDSAESLLRPVLAMAAILLLGAGSSTILAAYLTASLGVFLMARRLVARDTVRTPREEGRDDASLAHDILGYALPLMPMAVVIWISGLSDRYIIGQMMGREEVGIYAAAYGLMSTPFLMAHGILDRTLTPPYFSAVSAGDRQAERRLFRVMLAGTIGICGAGVLCVGVLKTWIAALLLAPSYRVSAGLMPWIALGNGILATEFVLAKYRYAHKQTRDILVVQTVGAAAALLTTIPMVRLHGVWGAAWACPIYYAAQLAFSILLRRVRKDAANDVSATEAS